MREIKPIIIRRPQSLPYVPPLEWKSDKRKIGRIRPGVQIQVDPRPARGTISTADRKIGRGKETAKPRKHKRLAAPPRFGYHFKTQDRLIGRTQ